MSEQTTPRQTTKHMLDEDWAIRQADLLTETIIRVVTARQQTEQSRRQFWGLGESGEQFWTSEDQS